MTESISIFTPVLLGAALVLLWLLNLEQARSLHQVADSLEEMHLLQLKNRRDQYQKDLKEINAMNWLSEQSGSALDRENLLGVSKAPAWINFRTADGSRLVISPLAPAELHRSLAGEKISHSRIGSAFEPLLGHAPRKVRVLCRSLAGQEWFDLEAAEVGRQLGVAWGGVTRLWFYTIPRKGRV